MLKRVSAAVLILTITAVVWGQTPPKPAKQSELQKLQGAFTKEIQEYYKPYDNVKTQEEAAKIKLDPAKNPGRKYLPKFKALAQKSGKTKDGYEAWMMVKQVAESIGDGKSADAASDVIMAKFIDTPWIGTFVSTLPYSYWGLEQSAREKKISGMLLKIEKGAKDGETKAAAMYARAKVVSRDGTGNAEEAAKIFRDLRAKYPKSQSAKRAERDVFEMEHLSVGKLAPDFEAVDENGEKFKLSDYRGKVVVLDFWGFW